MERKISEAVKAIRAKYEGMKLIPEIIYSNGAPVKIEMYEFSTGKTIETWPL